MLGLQKHLQGGIYRPEIFVIWPRLITDTSPAKDTPGCMLSLDIDPRALKLFFLRPYLMHLRA